MGRVPRRLGALEKACRIELKRGESKSGASQRHVYVRARGHATGPRRMPGSTNCPETCTGKPIVGRTDLVRSAYLHCSEDIGRWRRRRRLESARAWPRPNWAKPMPMAWAALARRQGVAARGRAGPSDACWPDIQTVECGRSLAAKCVG